MAGAGITIFLMADSVLCAKKAQKTPEGFYNGERMLGRLLAGKSNRVLLCGTCMDARGTGEAELMDGARHSTLDEPRQCGGAGRQGVDLLIAVERADLDLDREIFPLEGSIRFSTQGR